MVSETAEKIMNYVVDFLWFPAHFMAPFWHPFGERKISLFYHTVLVGTGSSILIPCTNKYAAISLDMPKNGSAQWCIWVSKVQINTNKNIQINLSPLLLNIQHLVSIIKPYRNQNCLGTTKLFSKQLLNNSWKMKKKTFKAYL